MSNCIVYLGGSVLAICNILPWKRLKLLAWLRCWHVYSFLSVLGPSKGCSVVYVPCGYATIGDYIPTWSVNVFPNVYPTLSSLATLHPSWNSNSSFLSQSRWVILMNVCIDCIYIAIVPIIRINQYILIWLLQILFQLERWCTHFITYACVPYVVSFR